MSKTTFTYDDKTITMQRVFSAPLEKVWEAFTTPVLFAKWWGPDGWTTTVKHMEVTPGGYLLYGMKCEDKNQGEWYGRESWGKSVYEAVEALKSLTYTDYFCDSEGTIDRSMPAMKINIVFESLEGVTKVTSVSQFESEEALKQAIAMGVEEGAVQTWERLEAYFQEKV